MIKRVYISGKITGVDDLNRAKFTAAERRLINAGFEAVNPHNLQAENDTWEAYMKADIKALADCDAVALLDDHHDSRGARIEVFIALRLGLKLICAHTLREIGPLEREILLFNTIKRFHRESIEKELGIRRNAEEVV